MAGGGAPHCETWAAGRILVRVRLDLAGSFSLFFGLCARDFYYHSHSSATHRAVTITMPKATQKQKLQKADFSKAKLKLGKGKQQPSNATNTSFKARSIALPGQAVLTRALQDPSASGEPTTAGGLGLDEVLLKTRHPNAGVKRDAIQGIKDILGVRPTVESGKVLATLGSLIADEVSRS